MYIFIKYHSQPHFENLFFMIASAKVMSKGLIRWIWHNKLWKIDDIFGKKYQKEWKSAFWSPFFSSFDPPPPPLHQSISSSEAIKFLPSRAWSLIFKFGRLWYLSRECRRELKPWIKPRSRSPRSSQQQWTKQQPR